MDEKMTALAEQIQRVQKELAALSLQSPIEGTWVAPDADRLMALHLDQGEKIGVVADLDDLRIRAVASQKVVARLIGDDEVQVAIKIPGRPDIELAGRIDRIIPAGQERLPSAALGYSAGGSTRIDLDDPSGLRAAEPFFEILVVPSLGDTLTLRPGQTTVLRFETSHRTLLAQGWRGLLQLFQGRFQG